MTTDVQDILDILCSQQQSDSRSFNNFEFFYQLLGKKNYDSDRKF